MVEINDSLLQIMWPFGLIKIYTFTSLNKYHFSLSSHVIYLDFCCAIADYGYLNVIKVAIQFCRLAYLFQNNYGNNTLKAGCYG